MQPAVCFCVDNKHNHYFSEVWKFRFLTPKSSIQILKQSTFVTQNALFSLLLDLFYCGHLVDQKFVNLFLFEVYTSLLQAILVHHSASTQQELTNSSVKCITLIQHQVLITDFQRNILITVRRENF